MTTFAQAIKTTPVKTTTENGMVALESSSNPCCDLFFIIGASRGKDITPLFEKAYQHDPVIATKILLWARDIREGAGERQIPRSLMLYLEENHPDVIDSILPKLLELGRTDDLLIFKTKAYQDKAFAIIKQELANKRYNIGKFLPREKSAKKHIAVLLRNYLGLTPKAYRKLLVENTDVVEHQMCAQEWCDINFSHVPSLASARYQKAFLRNCAESYAEYKEGLKNGTQKINAAAVYPYDVIKSINTGDKEVAAAQWDSLPNYIGDSKIIPMVDASGSMDVPAGNNPNLTCLNVAVSLGLYCADKNTGPFKDVFLTFSERPKLEVLKGNIVDKVNQLERADWGMSTDIEKAFALILNVATQNSLAPDQMPEYLAIFSDMQANQCLRNAGETMFQMASRQFEEAGYKLPKIIFWNLRSTNNVPVEYDTNGTALVSGFSPVLMKVILSGKDITPERIMLDVISNDRYNI